MIDKESLLQNNTINQHDELNQKFEELNEKNSKENLFLSGLKNTSLRETAFKSDLFFSNNENLFSKPKESKIKNDFNEKSDFTKKRESNIIENENSSSLKSPEEKMILENIESLVKNSIEENDDENERKEPKINQEKCNYDFSHIGDIFKDNNNNFQSPLFFGKKKLNILPNALTKDYILYCFLDKNMTKELQNLITGMCPKEIIDKIVKELKGNYSCIIKNSFGNYFSSDLFKVCEQKHRIQILKELSKTLSTDSNDKYGTYPIQILIEYASSEEEYNLILKSFSDCNNLLFASLEPNSSYVIQKIIKKIPEKYRKQFDLLFVSFINLIVRKKFGIINAKVFIDYTKNEEIMNYIANSIRSKFLEIVTDQYGKYFIQHLLEKWRNTKEGAIIRQEIINNFGVLYENKNSSYIADLFLKLANINEKKELMINNNLNIINKSSKNDKIVMMKIMKSMEQNLRDKSDNHNSNFNNHNQFFIPQNNFNINNNSQNFFIQNQLSLNNANNFNNNMFYKNKK